MRKEKLLYITPIPPPYGGIAVLCQSILNAGLKEHFDIIQLDTAKRALREKIDTIRLTGIINSFINFIRLIKLCNNNRDIKYAFITGTSNLAITRDYIYIVILKLFKIKPILYLHGTRKLINSSFIIRSLSRKAIKASIYVLSPTKADFEGAKLISDNIEKVRLFYNSTLVTRNVTNNYMISNQDNFFHIIGIGRFSDAKGSYDLLNACIELIEEGFGIQFFWIGRGAYETDDIRAMSIIKRLKIEVKNNIFLLKDLTEDEKFDFLSKSDLFVLPTKNDNLPISILEAMAFGLPVISTRTGAIPEVITNNENGWLVNYSDKKELKGTIIKAISSKVVLSQMSAKNKQDFYQYFDSTIRVREILALFEEAKNLR